MTKQATSLDPTELRIVERAMGEIVAARGQIDKLIDMTEVGRPELDSAHGSLTTAWNDLSLLTGGAA